MSDDPRETPEARERLGIPPLPLTAGETERLCLSLAAENGGGRAALFWQLSERVPAGVDPAAKIKAAFLGDIASGRIAIDGIAPETAVRWLGAMLGGYNLRPLLACLDRPELADAAVDALSRSLLADDIFPEVAARAKRGVPAAGRLLRSWAEGEWFTSSPPLPSRMRLAVYKVDGEVNTDDLSPARQASTRPDIPLHALSMGETRFPDGIGAISRLRAEGRREGFAPAFVADTLGTGSSRKSATNSLVWHLGEDIPHIPNKRRGGVVVAERIAPIFYNSFEDAGGLPLRADVSRLETGMRIALDIDAAEKSGRILAEDGSEMAAFPFPPLLADAWRAGGRIRLIIGRRLSARAAGELGAAKPASFAVPSSSGVKGGRGYTLAQKMVGAACGKAGVRPGDQCEPAMSTVGSQDTTGPMTRDELNDLACLEFSAPMVMQSFCHTAAYPTGRDRVMQQTLAEFVVGRGGVALRPGDGIIHSWLNRLLVPDKVGAGGDSHTRFPLGISFAAGSGMVALAAAMGFMPLEMPESVRVAFSGRLPAGIALRDVVNAIPLFAIEAGLVDKPGSGRKNAFNGRVMEMEGMDGLTVEEAFELTCASAERSAAAATVALELDKAVDYVESSVLLLASLLGDGYRSSAALANRKAELETWLENPALMRRDPDAEFAAFLDIDLGAIREPVIACPNNPDLVAWLSDRAGERVDEVFIGSCMSDVAHYRAAARIVSRSRPAARLWIAPPTRMARDRLREEGVWEVFEKAGARLEIPGCSLCMGNQARVGDNAVVFSTSTRNFDNRMGAGARVFLGSAALAAATAVLGKLPTAREYFAICRQAAV